LDSLPTSCALRTPSRHLLKLAEGRIRLFKSIPGQKQLYDCNGYPSALFLATALEHFGRFDEAEEYYLIGLKGIELFYGRDSLHSWSTIADLASLEVKRANLVRRGSGSQNGDDQTGLLWNQLE